VGRWVERRRASTWGTILLAAVAVFVALLVTGSPDFWARAVVFIGGLWLAYFGVTELLGLIRRVVPASEPRSRARRIGLVSAAVVVLAALVTGGLVLTA